MLKSRSLCPHRWSSSTGGGAGSATRGRCYGATAVAQFIRMMIRDEELASCDDFCGRRASMTRRVVPTVQLCSLDPGIWNHECTLRSDTLKHSPHVPPNPEITEGIGRMPADYPEHHQEHGHSRNEFAELQPRTHGMSADGLSGLSPLEPLDS